MAKHTISEARKAGDRYCTLTAGHRFRVYDVQRGDLLDYADSRPEADALADHLNGKSQSAAA